MGGSWLSPTCSRGMRSRSNTCTENSGPYLRSIPAVVLPPGPPDDRHVALDVRAGGALLGGRIHHGEGF